MIDLFLGAAAAGFGLLLGYILGIRVRERRIAQELAGTRRRLAGRVDAMFALDEPKDGGWATFDTDDILIRAAKYVHDFVMAQGTAAIIIEDSESPLRVVAGEGSLRAHAGRRVHEHDALVVVDAIGRERMIVVAAERPTVLFPGCAESAGVIAPIHAHGETVGAFLVDTGSVTLSPDHQRLVSTVATHTALRLANVRFFDLVRQGKEQWETVFDAISSGIAVLDHQHGIRRCNGALASLIAGPAAGSHICEALLGSDNRLHELLLDATKAGARRTTSARSERLDRLLEITAAPVRGPNVPEGWMVAVIEDVTEHRAIQARLIQNERLVAVGQLASGVAHELNNPLTSIGGLAEFLLSREQLSSKDMEHLAVITEQAARAQRIVRNLLTFARPGPDEVTEIDLSKICLRATRLTEYELKLRKVRLDTALATGLPRVRGDRHQLQQVIINLLTNAVHAAEQNGGVNSEHAIRIETREEHSHVVVLVSDTGPGISHDVMRNLFTPFFTTKDPGEGTGLGLSISYGIIKGHGGTLTVEQTGPEGTTFKISLPAAEPSAESSGPTVSGLSAEAAALPTVAVTHVLLVDDDPAVRRTIAALFSGEHHVVDAPTTASEAVKLLSELHDTFDLIIADPRTTTPDGESFAMILLQRWPHLRDKTILVSADVRPETTRWIQSLGCRFLTKPFNFRELLAMATKNPHGA